MSQGSHSGNAPEAGFVSASWRSGLDGNAIWSGRLEVGQRRLDMVEFYWHLQGLRRRPKNSSGGLLNKLKQISIEAASRNSERTPVCDPVRGAGQTHGMNFS